jgi:hypothetical protein
MVCIKCLEYAIDTLYSQCLRMYVVTLCGGNSTFPQSSNMNQVTMGVEMQEELHYGLRVVCMQRGPDPNPRLAEMRIYLPCPCKETRYENNCFVGVTA